jgi:hypothetical protein
MVHDLPQAHQPASILDDAGLLLRWATATFGMIHSKGLAEGSNARRRPKLEAFSLPTT